MAEAITLFVATPLLWLMGGFYYRFAVWVWRSLQAAWKEGVKAGQSAGSSQPGEIAMSEDDAGLFATSGNGPKYDYSAAAAAEILNLHFDPSQPKAVLFGRILFTILGAMERAEEELGWQRWEPSEN